MPSHSSRYDSICYFLILFKNACRTKVHHAVDSAAFCPRALIHQVARSSALSSDSLLSMNCGNWDYSTVFFILQIRCLVYNMPLILFVIFALKKLSGEIFF